MLPTLPRLATLALLAALPFAACSLPDSTSTSAETGTTTAADATAEPTADDAPDTASARVASGLPPLPAPPSADGRLPRSYAGLTLGDPPPAGAEQFDDPPPFYPEATLYILRIGESPRTRIAAYVHAGTIFRFEWRVQDADLDRDDVVDAFTERLGPPEDGTWLPEHVTNWNDGLSEGDTSIGVRRQPKSEWLNVTFEDTGRGLQLLRVGK